MFSKKPADDPRPAPMARPASGSTFSVIGSDVTITGNIDASVDLHVDGKVEGDIACASLVQGESSVVQGSIEADSARLSGTVRGSIAAKQLVVLASARIEGDVHYEALTIEQGATVEGRFAQSMPGKAKSEAPKAPDAGEPQLTIAN